jgi:hypothetical protein
MRRLAWPVSGSLLVPAVSSAAVRPQVPSVEILLIIGDWRSAGRQAHQTRTCPTP